jgi:hypothetical protein
MSNIGVGMSNIDHALSFISQFLSNNDYVLSLIGQPASFDAANAEKGPAT